MLGNYMEAILICNGQLNAKRLRAAQTPALRWAAMLVVGSFCGALHAMEINVLSAGAVEPGMKKFAAHVKQVSGHDMKIQFNTAPQIAKRLADGEVFDILVSPGAAMDRFEGEKKILAETRTAVGRVGVGVAVRTNEATPDISSEEKFVKTVLAADSIVYNQASTGLYLDKLFERLGIAGQLSAKTKRYANGASVFEHVLQGKGNEIGLGAMTEIQLFSAKGLKMVGPLPVSIQNWTSYEAARTVNGKAPDAVDAILRLMRTPAGKSALMSGGIE
jgi:molybdate transport system substrate-binding protein